MPPTATALELRRHRPGCYRVTLSPTRFAQIIKGRYADNPRWGTAFKDDATGRWWRVELRYTLDGTLMRHQGVFKTLRDVLDELSTLTHL